MVLSIGFPIININVGKTRDEKLKLLFIKDGDELSRYDLVET